MRGLYASPLGLLVGVSLGALGGGGSILAVPALVYGAGESTRSATSTSLLVVGVAALLGVGAHLRAGRVRLASGLLFGATGVGGSVVGTALNRHADPDVLLLAFSIVMVAAAAAMWRRQSGGSRPGSEAHRAPEPAGGGPGDLAPLADRGGTTAVAVAPSPAPPASPRAPFALTGAAVPRVVAAGTLVGLMTGFFGVGGGFVIVPALVLSLGFSMPEAVGTSLVVITVNSAVALALRAGSTDIRWADAAPFLAFAVIGTVAGKRVADRVPAGTLTRGFVALLVLVAAYTAASSAAAVW